MKLKKIACSAAVILLLAAGLVVTTGFGGIASPLPSVPAVLSVAGDTGLTATDLTAAGLTEEALGDTGVTPPGTRPALNSPPADLEPKTVSTATVRETPFADRVDPYQGSAPSPGEEVLLTFLGRIHPELSVSERSIIATAVEREAQRQRLDPWLIYAIIQVESRFRRDARGAAGEIGLMQPLPSTAVLVARHTLGMPGFDEELLLDPAFNIRISTAHLAYRIRERGGSLVEGLAAYNGGDRPPRVSYGYASRVLSYYHAFRKGATTPDF